MLSPLKNPYTGIIITIFSVFLLAINVAPTGSGLAFRNARAAISLPLGGDNMPDTGDDPLRMAETTDGSNQPEMPLVGAGGRDTIEPEAANRAEFLVEGLREGAHRVDFDITGDLWAPSLGRGVAMTGKAALSVVHPETTGLEKSPGLRYRLEGVVLFSDSMPMR
ncbi:MAG: hypothetical protein ACLFOY_14740 [Desulfatibacillaceae bacterium]